LNQRGAALELNAVNPMALLAVAHFVISRSPLDANLG
jgi:hypothetical protein